MSKIFSIFILLSIISVVFSYRFVIINTESKRFDSFKGSFTAVGLTYEETEALVNHFGGKNGDSDDVWYNLSYNHQNHTATVITYLGNMFKYSVKSINLRSTDSTTPWDLTSYYLERDF